MSAIPAFEVYNGAGKRLAGFDSRENANGFARKAAIDAPAFAAITIWQGGRMVAVAVDDANAVTVHQLEDT